MTAETRSVSRYTSERLNILPFFPAGAKVVLDTGCSTGGFGRTLRDAIPGLTLWGIEPDAESAALAVPIYDRVVVGLLPDDVPADAPKFDVVFFNDVLEHMVDPWSALKATRKILAPGGRVVASIPNVRHYYVLNKLLRKGDFTYTATGILDVTHLRFFTRSTMQEMFQRSGYVVESCEPARTSPGWKLNVLRLLLPRFGRDISVVQYAITAFPIPR